MTWARLMWSQQIIIDYVIYVITPRKQPAHYILTTPTGYYCVTQMYVRMYGIGTNQILQHPMENVFFTCQLDAPTWQRIVNWLIMLYNDANGNKLDTFLGHWKHHFNRLKCTLQQHKTPKYCIFYDSNAVMAHSDVITWKPFRLCRERFPFVGNQPSPMDYPHKAAATKNYGIIIVVSQNKLLNMQSGCPWFETTRCVWWYGPLTRYVILRVAGNVFPPSRVSDPDMYHGTCVTHVPCCMAGWLTSSFLRFRWWGKRSRNSRRIRNPQFYVCGKRPIR